MRIALLQQNPTVGAMDQNVQRLLHSARFAVEQGARLAVAPELCVCGYPPKDLLDRPSFVARTQAATEQLIRSAPTNLTLVFGSVGRDARGLTNDVVVARNGELLTRAAKQLLPTYDVFDEARHFEPGAQSAVVNVEDTRVWLSVCEDAWADGGQRPRHSVNNPLSGLSEQTADLLINISASPFTLAKRNVRPNLFAQIAQRHAVPVLFVNQAGGHDELIFDGQSAAWSAQGVCIARAKSFAEDTLLLDLASGGRIEKVPDSDEEAAYQALLVGVRDYLRKCGFSKTVIGLSGGIDSALVAALAADAVGPENVLGVAMPSRYSSAGSVSDARQLANNLGIGFQIIDIEPMFAAYLAQLDPVLNTLRHAGPHDVTLENIQARIRGNTLMAISNRTGALVLTTGNKSELAVGYCTLYGDMAGGLAVISDVPKTLVYRLAHFINNLHAQRTHHAQERIPQSSIDKPPSAELRPDQKDQDSLPPYDLLDRVLELYVEEQLGFEAIVAEGIDPVVVRAVIGLIERAEYKRRQAAPGLILTRKAFGPGRRIPLANHFSEI
jgi:NAD+ synthase (glutamine-hydrolysing)